MKSTDKIIDYLKKTYQPESIIVYGSFADGSANLNSDFDALIIAGKEKLHDSSFVDGVVLDVFIYPPDQFLSEYDPAEFAQVWDGKIILDKNGMGGWLKKNVLDYIEHIPLKTAKDVSQEIKWCEKMLLRTMRGDVEMCIRDSANGKHNKIIAGRLKSLKSAIKIANTRTIATVTFLNRYGLDCVLAKYSPCHSVVYPGGN